MRLQRVRPDPAHLLAFDFEVDRVEFDALAGPFAAVVAERLGDRAPGACVEDDRRHAITEDQDRLVVLIATDDASFDVRDLGENLFAVFEIRSAQVARGEGVVELHDLISLFAGAENRSS